MQSCKQNTCEFLEWKFHVPLPDGICTDIPSFHTAVVGSTVVLT